MHYGQDRGDCSVSRRALIRSGASLRRCRCAAAIFVVMHFGSQRSALPRPLSGSGQLAATFAQDGALIQAGHIYVAPPDRHMILGSSRIELSQGPKIHRTRPAADPLFISAAKVYGPRVLGIVLSGGDSDGAAGLRMIKECGRHGFRSRP
jgi:two-component system, chemotaxis family, protein-glutamate methylesterase/glutaminase